MNRAKGFRWAAVDCSASGRSNLALVVSDTAETIGAGVYTTSDVVAAPVLISRANQEATSLKRAVLINAGQANAYTGDAGLTDAERSCRELGAQLGVTKEQVFVASTGVIGARPPMDRMIGAMPALCGGLTDTSRDEFSRAIMTTDTRPKVHDRPFTIDGYDCMFSGCAKGAGMIMPNMATMLGVTVTDASIGYQALHKALRFACDRSFNRITVDGDTSTNDTVFVLANGAAGAPTIVEDSPAFLLFQSALTDHLSFLAKEIVRDGEGATKFIEVDVVGARSDEAAREVAMSIANSPLVKTAFFGEDLNFGRIAMAIGKARTGMNPGVVHIKLGDHTVARDGAIATGEALRAAELEMKKHDLKLSVDFCQGTGEATVWTCDLSTDYVRINADYTT